MENQIDPDLQILGQEMKLDINLLHRTTKIAVEDLMKVNGVGFNYDFKAMILALDFVASSFLDSQRAGLERNAELKQAGWNLDKSLNAEKMSDLAFEHIKKHAASKMKAAWHQLVIEAIFLTHPEFTLEMGDDENQASRYKRSVTFLDNENKAVEDQRRIEAGFSFAKAGKKPQTSEEAEENKSKLQSDLRLLASNLEKTEITWDLLAPKMKYSSRDSLRKAAGISISELKALGKNGIKSK